ncbi:MAG: bacillithiol biosynthesis cysteine-adding enzyme BshC [Acidobacteriota bacterium]
MGGSRLPPLPTAFLQGRDRDLLAPVRFLPPGELPAEPLPQIDRTRLAQALETANAAYGHPAAARQAALLADPATRVVVTGQQPGLYGGPLYALSKMVAAVLWAEAISATGVPAVPVFWVATEDHDWAEVAQAKFLTRKGVLKLDLGADPAPLLPVGMRTFGPGLTAIENELALALPHQYRPDARFGEAFCRLMAAALGERAPLMLDSMLPEVKQLQRPWLQRLVDQRQEVAAAQASADAAVQSRGYVLQVKPQPDASPLFMLHGQERRRILWTEDGGYALRGLEDEPKPLSELQRIIAENPSVISPGVLARPAIQDALLGTTLQVMGPAELTYMSQVAPVYSVLGISPPWTSLRPQALILEERQAGYLGELAISLQELSDSSLDQLVADRLGEDVIGPVRDRIEQLLDSLTEPLMAIDRGLENPLRKTQAHITRGLDQLNGKVAKAVARGHEVWLRRLQQVRQACFPEGHLQERVLSVGYFLDRHGPALAGSFCDQLGLDPRHLHIIRISVSDRGREASQ